MILKSDRRIAAVLVRAKVWELRSSREDLFRCVRLRPRFAIALWERMRARQQRDGLHHAPMCPGNEWSGAELVFQGCNCGAARQAREGAAHV